jgi:hypothetical protein
MENPANWGTLEKAVAAAEEDFWQTMAVCDGPEPLDLLAAAIAEGLADRGVVSPSSGEEVERAVLDALKEHGSAVERRVAGPSRVARIAAKLTQLGLSQAD